MKLFGAAALLAALLSPPLSAQRAFDVASIKENREPGIGGSAQFMPDGGLRARHMSPIFLITLAYGIETYQLKDAPGWATTTFYDIEAKPSEGGTRAELPERVRTLLEERFSFAFHRETKEIDGYQLVRVRTDRLGPGLREASMDCIKSFSEHPECREGHLTLGDMRTIGRPFQMLRQTIAGQLGAPVEDRTGLTGNYDVTLTWSTTGASTDGAPVFTTALQEQLGLKVESKRIATEMLYIDDIERPTPN